MPRKPASPSKKRRSNAPTDIASAKEIAGRYSIDPLDFLLAVVADENAEFEDRKDCAKATLPYIHPRLAAVEFDGELRVNPMRSLLDHLSQNQPWEFDQGKLIDGSSSTN